MAENKFKQGDQVLIKKKHLHGLAAVIMAPGGGETGDPIARISEEQFEGHLVQFPEESFVSVADLQKQRVKADAKAPHIHELSAGDRLEWDYPTD